MAVLALPQLRLIVVIDESTTPAGCSRKARVSSARDLAVMRAKLETDANGPGGEPCCVARATPVA
jgi:primosomal protein N'